MKKNLNQSFIDFLEKTVGQNEVALVIADGSQEISQFEAVLSGEGFKMVRNIHDLIEMIEETSSRRKIVYISPDHGNIKNLYDFVIQYPTGQVEISDSKTPQSKVIFPNYPNLSVVVLVLKEELQKFELANFSFLQHVGLTLQN